LKFPKRKTAPEGGCCESWQLWLGFSHQTLSQGQTMNVPKPPKWLLGILALAVLIAAARIENSGKPADIEMQKRIEAVVSQDYCLGVPLERRSECMQRRLP
jgi:hypothetical protein